MKRYFAGSVIILMLAASVGAQNPPPNVQNPAQNPPPGIQNPPQNPPRPAAPAAKDSASMATVEGCLVREADVAGRKPNVAERAGITEDYIVTSAKVVKGSAPGGSAQAAKPGETPVGTSGAQAMFEVTGINESELKDNLGRRVQIEGTFENLDRGPADDLVKIRGTVIRPVSGECSPKP